MVNGRIDGLAGQGIHMICNTGHFLLCSLEMLGNNCCSSCGQKFLNLLSLPNRITQHGIRDSRGLDLVI